MSDTWKNIARKAQERAVISAATELIGEKGFVLTTMDEIAERAGISKATIYKLFPSKEALLVRVMESINEEMVGEIKELQPGEFPEVFPRLLDLFLSQVERRQNFVRLLTTEAFSHGPFLKEGRKALYHRIIENRKFYRQTIEKLVEQGKNSGYIKDSPKMVSGFILATLKGVVSETPFYQGEEFRKFLNFVKEKILAMVGLGGEI